MSTREDNPDAVLAFWFGDAGDNPQALAVRNQVWFGTDPAFDESIRARFAATMARAAAGALRRWKLTPTGTLALILLFDQFPRNIYRGTPQAYAYDARAQALARDGIALGIDRELAIIERSFFYLPLEHAEDGDAQALSVSCFSALHAEAPPALRELTAEALAYAEGHRDIVRRFGRFPHRNLALDRRSNADELAWLADHRGGFGQG